MGLALNYGMHDFAKFSADNVAQLAMRLGGSRRFVSSVKTRTQYLLELTSDLKLDAKQIAHIIGMTAGNFRRIEKEFRDSIETSVEVESE